MAAGIDVDLKRLIKRQLAARDATVEPIENFVRSSKQALALYTPLVVRVWVWLMNCLLQCCWRVHGGARWPMLALRTVSGRARAWLLILTCMHAMVTCADGRVVVRLKEVTARAAELEQSVSMLTEVSNVEHRRITMPPIPWPATLLVAPHSHKPRVIWLASRFGDENPLCRRSSGCCHSLRVRFVSKPTAVT